MTDRLRPDQAIRILRAKNGELETWALQLHDLDVPPPLYELVADVALVAALLADLYEHLVEGAAAAAAAMEPPDIEDVDTELL